MKLYRIPLVVAFIAMLFVFTCYFIQTLSKDEAISIRDYQKIKSDGVLRVVTNYNSLGYYPTEDGFSGFNHDIIQIFKSQVSIKVEVDVVSTLNDAIKGLKEGRYDLLASNVPIIASLQDSLSFTHLIGENRLVLIQQAKSPEDTIKPLRSLLDLGEKEIYVPKNSPGIMRLENIAQEIGEYIEIKEADSNIFHLMEKVSNKEIDFTICDELTAQVLQDSLPNLDSETAIGFSHLEAWAVNKQSVDLLDSINLWIDNLQKTPEFKKIHKSYYANLKYK